MHEKQQKTRRLSFQHLEPRLPLDASMLRITEIMASNDNTLSDFEGDSSDWIEIYNPSSTVADLSGLHLTDKSDNLTKWEFPAGSSVAPGGYLLVFASKKDTVAPNGELHTSFSLSADGEYVGLVAANGITVIDAYSPEFPPQSKDISYGLEMEQTDITTTLVSDASNVRAWVPTSDIHDATWTQPPFNDALFNLQGTFGVGYEASPGGSVDVTNEIGTLIPQNSRSVYTRSSFTLNTLEGLDQLTLRMKYDDGFVAYLNGVQIAAANAPETAQWDSFATANHDDPDTIIYENFDANVGVSALRLGENVLAIHLLNVSDTSSDLLISPELIARESVFTSPEKIGFFETPTPGYANGESIGGFTAEPTFSIPHGYYSSTQNVTLSSETPGAMLVYTIDGSLPTINSSFQITNGSLYTAPITINLTSTIRARAFKLDHKPSDVQASSYLFVEDVITQSLFGQSPTGWPAGDVNGQDLDFGIDPDIINQYGGQAVKDALLSLPAITLTTDLANLFNPSTGIYVNAGNRGSDWERETSVELIHPDGSEGFSTNAGLRIRGGFSRNDFNPKHAFRLYFRKEYGDGKLDYPLFGDEGVDEFDVLDLRTPQNYSWSSSGDVQNTFLREVFSRDTQADFGQTYTRSSYFHLYLDGQYWGIFMTQERAEQFFGESYLGGNEEDYDVVKSDLGVSGGTEVADGNDIAWQQLFLLAQGLADSPSGAADNYWSMQGLNPDGTNDPLQEELLDVDNLIDYMLILFYTGGYDTGLSRFLGNTKANNWVGMRNRETGDQGFQFFMHDNEHSLGADQDSTHNTFGIDRTGPFYHNNDRQFDQFNPQYLHQDLLVHPEYRQRFTDRVQQSMFNDGVLTIGANTARLLERKQQVEPAIIAEAARWGDSKVSTPHNKTTWDNEVSWIINTYFPGREAIVLNQLENDGLFTDVEAPTFSQFGGIIDSGYQLSLSVNSGSIYYSTDGQTDPRLIGGGINMSSNAQIYSGSIVLTDNTTVWARTRQANGEWSGLVKTTFTIPTAGDYDLNGLVEQADYDLWVSTYGSTTDLRADGNQDGRIDAADYTVWRDQLNAATSLAAATASTEASAPQSETESIVETVGIVEAESVIETIVAVETVAAVGTTLREIETVIEEDEQNELFQFVVAGEAIAYDIGSSFTSLEVPENNAIADVNAQIHQDSLLLIVKHFTHSSPQGVGGNDKLTSSESGASGPGDSESEVSDTIDRAFASLEI